MFAVNETSHLKARGYRDDIGNPEKAQDIEEEHTSSSTAPREGSLTSPSLQS
jgi:hypothetical protein